MIYINDATKYNQYTLFDLNGRVLLEDLISNDITKLEIGSKNLPKGIYMLTLKEEDSIQTIKVIKI